jgi:hypothetical protein
VVTEEIDQEASLRKTRRDSPARAVFITGLDPRAA